MLWKPKSATYSTVDTRFSVHELKNDVFFDFVKGDVKLDDKGSPVMVSGLDNFVQKVKKSVLTPKTEWCHYGFNHKVWESESQADFDQECLSLSLQMVNQSLTLPGSGLGHYIEKITQMHRYDESNYRFLAISMFVTGETSELVIIVPKKMY